MVPLVRATIVMQDHLERLAFVANALDAAGSGFPEPAQFPCGCGLVLDDGLEQQQAIIGALATAEAVTE